MEESTYTSRDVKREANKRDAWLLMQLAESGRPVEQLAQFIASYIAGCGMSNVDAIHEGSLVINRVTELLSNQNEIWPELMPGPGGECIDSYKIVPMDHVTIPADLASRLRKVCDDTINFAERGF